MFDQAFGLGDSLGLLSLVLRKFALASEPLSLIEDVPEKGARLFVLFVVLDHSPGARLGLFL